MSASPSMQMVWIRINENTFFPSSFHLYLLFPLFARHQSSLLFALPYLGTNAACEQFGSTCQWLDGTKKKEQINKESKSERERESKRLKLKEKNRKD
ncbi:hypothetical protein CDAR_240631 [Caerostris darwini]|uniref:Uncharacterized protein n=1 Tax=Caerostris darwini TaxID=1538125 RepID=A0AAV4PLQ9_9ARAC|nr:hypothetical protein CDAR_240631 [Caerostris darwini]